MKHIPFLKYMCADEFWSFVTGSIFYIKIIAGFENKQLVGEVYVLPEYRCTGLVHDLLNYAENHLLSQGAVYMWVEHGTANPNARGFWNKYFDTYQYEMIRQIIC